MTSQRPRRPTAWEVSFPGESSEGENGDEEIVSEPDELEREQEELAVLNGKRKTCSIVDGRVRLVPFSIPSLLNKIISRRNVTVGNPRWSPGKQSRNRMGIAIARYIMPRDLMSSPSLRQTLPSS